MNKRVIVFIGLLFGVLFYNSMLFAQETVAPPVGQEEAVSPEEQQVLLKEVLKQFGIPTEEETRILALKNFLNVKVSPEAPFPKDNVIITVSSSQTNLDVADISWFVNGVRKSLGSGNTKYEFVAGETGSIYVIDIVISTQEGDKFNKTITIRPAGVDLFWEANTYTPGMYKGKPLASPESTVRIVALPNFKTTNGNALSAKDLLYTWKVGEKTISGQSGLGKQMLETKAPKPFGKLEVSVKVSSAGGTYYSERSIKIPVSDPEVLIYEVKPLLGTLFNSVFEKSYYFTSNETTLRAEPYFFSKDGLSFNWLLDGVEVGQKNSSISLLNDGIGSGFNTLSVMVSTAVSTFQNIVKNISVSFETI